MATERRIAFLWQLLPGYLADCLNTLNHDFATDIRVFGLGKDGVQASDAMVEPDLFHGVQTRLWNRQEYNNDETVKQAVREYRPDLIVMSGWVHKPYRKLLFDRDFEKTPIVLATDNTFKNTFKQFLGKYMLRSIFNRVQGVIVPGDRGSELMKYWSVPDSKIHRGVYSFDFDHFYQANALRKMLSAKPRFLFVGRLDERKGLPHLLDAYRAYRAHRADPWDLLICGRGPLANLCQGEGIDSTGFVGFRDLPERFASASVFVFPSLYDAWGVALAEACAAGMPVICTNTCGASADLICDSYNGFIIGPGDSQALARLLEWFHDHVDQVAEFGERSIERARAYSGFEAAKRWNSLFTKLLDESKPSSRHEK